MGKFVLSLNCGSSSLKFNLFRVKDNNRLEPEMHGIAEEIGSPEISGIKFSFNSKKEEVRKELPTHKSALEFLFSQFESYGVKAEDVVAIGHRVVHGGEKYTNSVLIDDNVINTIKQLIPLAPLHNQPNLTGIEETFRLLRKSQVAVFDTTFHSTLPEYSFKYQFLQSGEKYGVRKYGPWYFTRMYQKGRVHVKNTL